jgi:hypothetical protein
MTVCIAAMADNGKRIVCAADTMIANATSSADSVAGKVLMFRDWTFLMSGTLSPADLLYDTVKREMGNAADNEHRTVRRCLEIAHREEMGKWMAGRWLSPYNLDWESYGREHTSRFTDEYRDELSRKMLQDADSNYDAEVIVCGWGDSARKNDNGVPYIFSINRDGVGLHRTEGAYACGGGAPAAMASLYFHRHRRSMTLAQVVYYVLAARFMAERTVGVGRDTTMLAVLRREASEEPWYILPADQINTIRAEWMRRGAPRMPNGMEDKLLKILKLHEPQLSVTPDHMISSIKKASKQARSDKSEA